MGYLKAYVNYDCSANCYDDSLPMVDIYEIDGGDFVAEDFESYKTIEDMQKRADYINSHNLTWDMI